MNILLKSLAVGLLGSTLLFSAAVAQTIKFGTIPPEGPSPEHKAAVAFKEHVEQRSGGRLKVRIFPGGQLGSGAQMTEGVRDGTLEMAQVDDGSLSTFVPAAQVFTLPYALTSEPEAWEVFRGDFKNKLAEEIYNETGIRLLAMAVNGFRSFTNSRRPIETAEDLAGLKIRVIPSPAYMKMVEALGAAATPIPAPELILALQQGVADGQENHPTVILNFGIADVQKYVTLTEHIMGVHATIINGAFFDGLSKEDQLIVAEAATIHAAVQNVEKVVQHSGALAEIRGKGLEVTFLSAEEKGKFRSLTQRPVREYLASEIGEEWVRAYEAAAAEGRARLLPH